jgi:long-chain acyl-CoA synthetase
MNVAEHLERATRHFPDRVAIAFEGQHITYSDLDERVNALAHALVRMGVSSGDRVALFLPNVPEFVVALFAAHKIGAVAVSANVMLIQDELRYLLEDSGATVLFTSAALANSWQPLVGQVVDRDRVVVCDGLVEGFASIDAISTRQSGPFRTIDLRPDDPAAILYTSGTTGRQKGATLSQGNLVSNTFACAHVEHMTPDDRLLCFLPLFHCFGQNAITISAFAAAATVVLQRRFDLQATVDLVERERVTMFFAVPTIYIALLNAGVQPERLRSVRYYFSAAATMPVEIATRWTERFGQPIFEGYGLTETSPFASYNHIWHHRPGSVGTPIENVEMKVLDPSDNEVEPGAWGEIVIKGPNVMLGYWNRPQETAEAIRNGWFHTGDIGYMDADGYFYLVDRTKDMINSAGFKVWPREVEEILFQHPAIGECAVVGAPDELNGEIPVAFVVLRPDQSLSAEQFEAYCRQKLAAYKVPRRVMFTEALPKNATGKILKRVLRDQAARQPVAG